MVPIADVLFVCTHGSGRSQIAAGLLRMRAGGRVNVHSAALEPADRMNPVVIAAMDEIGVDLSRARPQPLTDDLLRTADVVITMSCGDVGANDPRKQYRDWELQDPNWQDLASVRVLREEIDRRVQTLMKELELGA